jgi:hypothetical protein
MIGLLRDRQYANIVRPENRALKLSLVSDWILVAGALEITTPELRNGPELSLSEPYHALRDESIYVRAQAFGISESTTRSARG